MKNTFNGIRKISIVCLLVVVGIFCISPLTVKAASIGAQVPDSQFQNEIGTPDARTNIEEPGSAETADDLKELNIANNLTISYENGNGEVAGTLRILIILTLIALAPTLLIMLTSFTRIIIVLHFTRSALNTQTAPPNQVLIGLTLFLTFFIMSPVITEINTEALKPYEAGEITQEEFFERGMEPLREFMYGQTQSKDVKMFLEISQIEWDGTLEGIPTSVLIPSFIISELRTAFIIGFFDIHTVYCN